MQAAEAIIEILRREGVSTFFCYPTTPLIETAVAAGMRPVICRQERVGVDMADGFGPRHQRQAGRRLRHAVRAGRGERLSWHRHRIL